MIDIRLQLSALWVAVVLVYLYGDVLRIFSRDFPDVMDTKHFSGPMWLGIAVLMSIPIIMVVVSLLVADPGVTRWANIIAAGFFFVFNLVGLPTYPSAYDKYLLLLSMVFNVLTVIIAWNWVASASGTP